MKCNFHWPRERTPRTPTVLYLPLFPRLPIGCTEPALLASPFQPLESETKLFRFFRTVPVSFSVHRCTLHSAFARDEYNNSRIFRLERSP